MIVSVIVSIIVTKTSRILEGATGADAIYTESTFDFTLSLFRLVAVI